MAEENNYLSAVEFLMNGYCVLAKTYHDYHESGFSDI